MNAREPIRAGAVIGDYRVDSQLAVGGMGVIYRATDSKFERRVAIKFLSREIADADARRRFQREAQLASSLNHPHILTIYDVGEFGEQQYLVTEYVDGGTVREWKARAKPGWRQIVELLVGVADALAVAHEAEILHRDIKPDNILVSKGGYAKLADFGVAKLVVANGVRSDAPTALTRMGAVIGTPGYMSPEQSTASEVDARSDVFSFGVVLYELLTGIPPFTGKTDTEICRAVIHQEMPPLPPNLPTALRMIVEKALEKDPADRYQSMRDFVVDLRRLAHRQIRETGDTRAYPGHFRLRHPGVAALAAIFVLAGGFWAGATWIEPSQPIAVSGNTSFQRMTDFVGIEEMPAVSPDGSRFAFTATAGGWSQIWLRGLAGRPPQQLTVDERDHLYPRWSPDSNSLIFFAPGEDPDGVGTLWEISALGGEPRRIASALGGADISRDGSGIAAFQRDGSETVLAILNRDGSVISTMRGLPDAIDFRALRWSPGDDLLAFSANSGGFTRIIYVLDVESEAIATVVEVNNIDGLTWMSDGTGLIYSSSAGSTLPYPPVFNLRAVSLDSGVEQQLTFGDVSYIHPDLAPDGRLLASRERMESDIWQFPVSDSPDANVRNAKRITIQTGQVQTPSVSPDGTEIAYLSDSGGRSNVWISSVDGSGSRPRQLTFERDPDVLIGIPNWSPAGDFIVYIRTDTDDTSEWLVNSDGSGSRQLVQGVAANWSSDGRWLYYATPGLEDCVDKILIETGEDDRVRCSAVNPLISADGQTLYFSPTLDRQNQLMKASPEDGPAEPLAAYAAARIPAFPTGYALSPNGQWLAVPLRDGRTTNIWAIATDSGNFTQITDFGNRNTLITRQVSWSPDGEFIYAALVESDADIVMLDIQSN